MGVFLSSLITHFQLQLVLRPLPPDYTLRKSRSSQPSNRSLQISSEPPHLLRGPDGSKRTIGGCNRASCVKELAEVKSWLAKSRATRSSVAKSTASACEWVWSSGTGSRCRLEDRYSSP